jgi:hypothetical protein
MINSVLFYVAGSLPVIWGIAHIIPVKNVVKGFGEISVDNKRILMMEWINEGLTLIFLGILIIIITLTGEPGVEIKRTVYFLSAAMLIVMSVISLFTGFKVNFLPYKLCPVIFSVSAILIVLGLIV